MSALTLDRDTETDIELNVGLRRRKKPTPHGFIYDAIYRGNVIASSRDPETDACRALVKMGITGRVTFWHEGAKAPSMTADIEKLAKLRFGDNLRDGPTVQRHVPFEMPLASTALSQGAA
jgi:hypothetical protein